MKRVCRYLHLVPLFAAAGLLVAGGHPERALAQLRRFEALPGSSPSGRVELDETVQLDRADSKVLADLERVRAYLADRQWNEAIETLCQVMEHSEDKLLGVTDRRYVGLRDYGHLQLAALPAEALKLYRSRVDPLARKWYEEGVSKRHRGLLQKVVERAFASSWGDDALMALGEMALESGDCALARWHWERIIPTDPPPDEPRTWPGFPDTDLDLAAVRARLVLVSILEGSPARARDELTRFTRLHADARGRLGGREVNYVEALGALLAEGTAWPRKQSSPDWPTFAGNTLRNRVASELIDFAGVAWRMPLNEAATGTQDAGAPLSYYPVLLGDLVLVNNRHEIMAVDARTGKPAWGGAAATIYRDRMEGLASEPSSPSNTLGAPRCTMTAFGDRLYARMGATITSGPQEPGRPVRPGYLVALDLAAEGRLMWKIVPEEGWAFEGSPVADAASVYVAMRRNDIRPQAHVACFDAQSGRRRWRRFVCGADTPARGTLRQNTHNLLSLRREMLYYNTNLGAVAALSARDGRLNWVSLYPRAHDANLSRLAPHWQRDLNPCLVDRGTLLVAPADSPRIFALEALNGQILWHTGPEVEDVVHLLGTTAEHLIAGGHRLYWIGLKGEAKGRVEHVWPDSHEKPGYGRGILAGSQVLWPTREKIYVFDHQTARLKRVIDLVPRGISGGNLLVAGGRLLIATGHELIAVKQYSGVPTKDPSPTLSLFSRRVYAAIHPAWTPGLNSVGHLPTWTPGLDLPIHTISSEKR